jgi:GT2 family glycosyltransferase
MDHQDRVAGSGEPPPAAAPPVVAVMVTCDPGPWLEEALDALEAQDYPNLSVLVVDSASSEDPTSRVAAMLPGAYVRRLETNRGFAAAANEVLNLVEGASHYVFLHDDAAPAPDAIRLLVEEAYRSNAGVVAPKLVEWHDPRRLLAVGMAVDKAGVPGFFGRGELDQAQHDAVRDVFVAPGGCMLVRADLFASLAGFDADMPVFGEDLDLCWRAQVLGARVMVAPAAQVRHLEATADGLRPLRVGREGGSLRDRVRTLELGHRLRTVLKCYGGFHLVRVLPQIIVLAAVESVYGLLSGRRQAASAIVEAWRWNLTNLGGLWPARRQTQRQRRVSDGDVRRLQTRGSASITAFLRGQLAVEERTRGVSAMGRELASSFGREGVKASIAVWLGVFAVLVIGARDLLGGALPAIGQLAPFPDGPLGFLRPFLSGWRTTGLGSPSPAPPAFALLGLAGILLGGSMGFLQKLVVLGALPAGLVGAYRLARPVGSWRARLVAVVVYAAVPLPYAALARGRWSGVIAYGAMPWILARLMKATALAPFGTPVPAAEPPLPAPSPASVGPGAAAAGDVSEALGADGGNVDALEAEEIRVAEAAVAGVPRPAPPTPGPASSPPPPVVAPVPLTRQLWPAGILVAVVAAFVPAMALVTLLAAFGLVAGALLVGKLRETARALALAGAAGGVAAVLLFPWTLDLLLPGAGSAAVGGPGPPASRAPGFGELLRFETASMGGGLLGWAFLIAATLPLVIGQGWRFSWAARLWMVALTCWAVAWVAGRGWLGLPPPTPEVVLAPAAISLAVATALGLAAFETDLPGYRFGWHQVAFMVAASAALVASLPVLAASLDGRWGLPRRDFARLLSWMPERKAEGSFRVLWIGDPEALPLDGWRLDDGLAYATSRDGPPDAVALWPAPDTGATRLLGQAVATARQGETSRLGRLLAPMAVRYVVLAERAAPSRDGTPVLPVPADLTQALRAQVDLRLVETDEAIQLYENAAWGPGRGLLDAEAAAVSRGSGPRAAASASLSSSPPVLPRERGPVHFTGTVPGGADVFLSEAASSRWELVAGGEVAERRVAFGWANAFEAERGGNARLRFRTPLWRYAAVLLELGLWVIAVRLATTGGKQDSAAQLGREGR